MRRFFSLGTQIEPGLVVTLEGDEHHHLKNVCRLEVGEQVEILNGKGDIATAVIENVGKKSTSVRLTSCEKLSPPEKPLIRVVLCLPKLATFETVIQKMVELGASEVIPVVSDRSFVKKVTPDLLKKSQRWERIGLEACKQSGRAWPLTIHSVGTLKKMIQECDSKAGLFLYEGPGMQDIKTALKEVKGEEVTIFVGSEGGFSLTELEQFKTKGLVPITMGPLVLRVETACIALLSVIKYEFDRMR